MLNQLTLGCLFDTHNINVVSEIIALTLYFYRLILAHPKRLLADGFLGYVGCA